MTAFGVLEIIIGSNMFWISLERELDIRNFTYLAEDRLGLGISDRIKSTCWHSISYSMWLILLYSLVIFFKVNSIWTKKILTVSNVFFVLVSLLVLINVLYTQARSGWISLLILIVLLIFQNQNKILGRNKLLRYQLIINLIPFALLIAYSFWILVNSVKGGSTTNMRIDQFNFIYEKLISKSFYLGYGPYAIDTFMESSEYADALGFESFFFQVFVSNGLIGLLGYIFFFLGIVQYPNKSKSFFQIKNFIIPITFAYTLFILLTGEMRTLHIYFIVISFITQVDNVFTTKMIKQENPVLLKC
ncbi:hypothetical protein C3K47_17540 [Solitalea longa]|uniref:O-antigen ligase-related domain-containing protein n=2 Tax=Solitalea longa TaxID=2079460 RepID=A0A2S4ZY30_9SPHI|nr:hypothetical protein C3K47_17540 [Solitalea longa]